MTTSHPGSWSPLPWGWRSLEHGIRNKLTALPGLLQGFTVLTPRHGYVYINTGAGTRRQIYPAYDPSQGRVAHYDFVKMGLYFKNKVFTKHLSKALCLRQEGYREQKTQNKQATKRAGMAPTLAELSSRTDTNKRGKEQSPAMREHLGPRDDHLRGILALLTTLQTWGSLSSHLVLHITFTLLESLPHLHRAHQLCGELTLWLYSWLQKSGIWEPKNSLLPLKHAFYQVQSCTAQCGSQGPHWATAIAIAMEKNTVLTCISHISKVLKRHTWLEVTS